MDPKPNPSVSDYAVMANSPIWKFDPMGDEVHITHRTGFLGLGKKETLNYKDGKLFKLDGTAFTGKISVFLENTMSALGEMSKAPEGASMLSELQEPLNIFEIVKGSKNKFLEDHTDRAYAEANGQKDILPGGSGGKITFAPFQQSLRESDGAWRSRPTFKLAHEMFHGLDANRGVMSTTQVVDGIIRDEFQASYRENILRGQLKIPYRSHYGEVQEGDEKRLIGPLLDKNNKPTKPSWYKY
jgi:hypothetical protein